MSTQIEWAYHAATLMRINIYNYILSDSEGSLLTFSQSCNGDKKENPHSHHIQLHHHCVCTSVLLVWKLSWKHFVWYYLVCRNARHFILAPKRFSRRVCQTCVFDSFCLQFTFEQWVWLKLEAAFLIQPHPLTSGILIKVVEYVQVKCSKEWVCIALDLSSSDASDIIVVVQVFLIWT